MVDGSQQGEQGEQAKLDQQHDAECRVDQVAERAHLADGSQHPREYHGGDAQRGDPREPAHCGSAIGCLLASQAQQQPDQPADPCPDGDEVHPLLDQDQRAVRRGCVGVARPHMEQHGHGSDDADGHERPASGSPADRQHRGAAGDQHEASKDYQLRAHRALDERRQGRRVHKGPLHEEHRDDPCERDQPGEPQQRQAAGRPSSAKDEKDGGGGADEQSEPDVEQPVAGVAGCRKPGRGVAGRADGSRRANGSHAYTERKRAGGNVTVDR